jgi:hypothetical protein
MALVAGHAGVLVVVAQNLRDRETAFVEIFAERLMTKRPKPIEK